MKEERTAVRKSVCFSKTSLLFIPQSFVIGTKKTCRSTNYSKVVTLIISIYAGSTLSGSLASLTPTFELVTP